MKKSLKALTLKKSIVSELNGKKSDVIQGGRYVKTNADTLCTSNAIICQPSINFACETATC